jgi:hypothetical protein
MSIVQSNLTFHFENLCLVGESADKIFNQNYIYVKNHEFKYIQF